MGKQQPELFVPYGRVATRTARRPERRFVGLSKTRFVLTVLLLAGGAFWFRFPLWGLVLFPSAGVAIQLLRRWDWTRWLLWSVTLSAFGAEAALPLTWELRFGICFALLAPFVVYAGSVLRSL